MNATSGKDASAQAGKAAATLSGERVSETKDAGPQTATAATRKLTANLSEELASDYKTLDSDDAASPMDRINANLSGERVTDVQKAKSEKSAAAGAKPNVISSCGQVAAADADSAGSNKQAAVDVGKLNVNLSGERVTDAPKAKNEEASKLAAKLHVNLSGEHVAEPEAAEPPAAKPKVAEPKEAGTRAAEPNVELPTYRLSGNLSDDRAADFKKAFEVHDAEGSGHIPASQLGTVLRSLGYKLTEADIQELLGPKPKASISFSEFIAMMTKDVLVTDPEDEFKQVFRVFDRNGDGFVSCAELRQAMTTLGQKLSTEDVDEMIRVADKDAKGKLTFDEFVTMVTFK